MLPAALLLVIASAANAAGLGKLVVLSAMGEPFRAEIELLPYSGEPDALTLRLAPPEAYPSANFRYNPALAGTRLNIRAQPNGRQVIDVVSLRPLNEPFVYLLVGIESGAARIVRGYTVLLDPPGYRSSREAAAAEYQPAAVPVVAAAAIPSATRAAVDPGRAVARQERLSDADARTLADMLERVAALELAVAQLQRQWEKPGVVQAAAPALNPLAVKVSPGAAPSPPLAQQQAPAEAAPHRASDQDSLVNEALLVLALGLLLLLGGLVYVIWGRSTAQGRPAKNKV